MERLSPLDISVQQLLASSHAFSLRITALESAGNGNIEGDSQGHQLSSTDGDNSDLGSAHAPPSPLAQTFGAIRAQDAGGADPSFHYNPHQDARTNPVHANQDIA